MDYPAGSTALGPKSAGMPWLVRGDVDGFFGLAIDNLVQLLVIVALCRGVLGFSDTLIFGAILPGVAVSLVVGNVFYAWQAKELSRRTARRHLRVALWYQHCLAIRVHLSRHAAGPHGGQGARAWR